MKYVNCTKRVRTNILVGKNEWVRDADAIVQFPCGKGHLYEDNVNFAEGTRAKAQGTRAMYPSHEICKLHKARAH